MINANGMVQNNGSTIAFLKELKTSKIQYKTLTKEEERKIVEDYVEPMKYLDGRDVLDTGDPMYLKWAMEKDESKRKNLYYRVRRVLTWKKPRRDFCNLLVMHNIRFVFNISKKYCKNTRDYDNMIARGLYGLVKAADRFNPFAPITRKDPNDPNNKIVTLDEHGDISPIKFCTYAKSWIFKYIVGEFLDKTLINIDNYSNSLDATVRIKNSDSTRTLENYLDGMIDPAYCTGTKSTQERIEFNETKSFYDQIEEYLRTTNELTAMERDVIIDTYYNSMKTREISEKMNKPQSLISSTKTKALKKIKKYIAREYHIKSYGELV